MDKEKIQKFEKLLKDEKIRILEDLLEDNADFVGLEQTDMGDLVDQAYKLQEKEMLINLSHNEQKILDLIESALDRIKDNTFGKCVSCGVEMDENRLEALPYAQDCVDCKNKKRRQLEV
jgi:RNA polymerase-binding protein DksA